MKHICAWCRRTIRLGRGRSVTGAGSNFGMCSSCLAEKLAAIAKPLGRREIRRARRMHRCGRSVQHIGRVLGVSGQLVESVLDAA